MVEIHDVRFNVNIERKRIKNIYLRVKDNTLLVTCPYYVNEYEVYNFINARRDWIYKAYQYSAQKKNNSLLYRGGNLFYIFGKPYQLVRSIGRKNIKIIDNTIYFTYKDDSEESIKALYKYLDSQLLLKAQEYYLKYQYMLEDYGYHQVPEIGTRIMSSRWGVCFTRKNKINISSYLIHYPEKCLEYIMVHEMTHFIIPNHSKRFYQIILNNMPDYKIAEELLK